MLLLGLLILTAARLIPVHVYDGFESSGLSWSHWSSQRMVSGAATIQDQICPLRATRFGHHSAPGDRYEAASDDGVASERDELLESGGFISRIGQSYVYSFSLYLPRELPQNTRRAW